jgi:hypothetical protein
MVSCVSCTNEGISTNHRVFIHDLPKTYLRPIQDLLYLLLVVSKTYRYRYPSRVLRQISYPTFNRFPGTCRLRSLLATSGYILFSRDRTHHVALSGVTTVRLFLSCHRHTSGLSRRLIQYVLSSSVYYHLHNGGSECV